MNVLNAAEAEGQVTTYGITDESRNLASPTMGDRKWYHRDEKQYANATATEGFE